MSPLNDDELSSLLEQAKSTSPEPSPELAERTLRAYQANFVRPKSWRGYFLRPLSIPWPLGVLAAVFLVLFGALADHSFRRPSTIIESHTPEATSQSAAILTFKEFQPVSEIRPRVIRGPRDDQ